MTIYTSIHRVGVADMGVASSLVGQETTPGNPSWNTTKGYSARSRSKAGKGQTKPGTKPT